MIDPLILPIIALAIPIVIVPVVMATKQARHDRELEHIERLKALELGRTLPGDEPWWTPVRLCAAIGVGVPVIAFACAFLGGIMGLTGPSGEGAWLAACFVGTAGILCGTFLAHRHLLPGGQTSAAQAKPVFDADAYDVVGRRG